MGIHVHYESRLYRHLGALLYKCGLIYEDGGMEDDNKWHWRKYLRGSRKLLQHFTRI